MLEDWTGPIAAGTLVVLWTCEAFFPAFKPGDDSLAQRGRHLLIGLANAGVGAAAASLLLAADRAAAAEGIGMLRWIEAPWWITFVLAFCLLDLWHYAFHVIAHKTPVLWRFHAVHHNAERMEATVAMRFHMVEIALQCFSLIPIAVLMGASIYHVLAYNLVLLPVSMFHHSDIRLSPRVDRALRLLIVTPRMHWLHHSRWQPETDSNYSGVLSIWDRLFGTMRSRLRAETVDIGLDGHGEREVRTLSGMLAAPFGDVRSTNGVKPDDSLLTPDEPLIPIPERRAGPAAPVTVPSSANADGA